jgi:hypothetical protein
MSQTTPAISTPTFAAFTMLWPGDYCRYLQSIGATGEPLHLLWGGHNQQTRFSHFKVRPGNYLYPLHLRDKTLYLIGRMKVDHVMTRQCYLEQHPEHVHLIRHDCANEVLAGQEGTPIRFDRAVPADVLERWRFRSGKEERALKYLEEGRLLRTLSLEGIYRLAEQTRQDLDHQLGT